MDVESLKGKGDSGIGVAVAKSQHIVEGNAKNKTGRSIRNIARILLVKTRGRGIILYHVN
jgi:hypothetical protein